MRDELTDGKELLKKIEELNLFKKAQAEFIQQLQVENQRRDSELATIKAAEQQLVYSIAGINLFLLNIDIQGKIIYINSAFLRYLGMKRETLIGNDREALKKSNYNQLVSVILAYQQGENIVEEMTDENGRVFKVNIAWQNNEEHVVIEDTTDNAKLKSYVARYISQDINEFDEEDLLTFKMPERRYMTVSFTDLRGFTKLSEGLSPEDVRIMLNAYLEATIKAVDDNKATVDKIVGDELMALYGAPRRYKDHAFRAIKTCIEQQQNLKKLQIEMEKSGRIIPECGIGVNTGDMVVGSIGCDSRQDYTVLGASVNLGAHLCGIAKGGQILITEATLKNMLDNLPNGWTYQEYRSGETVHVDRLGGKTEAVFDLDQELTGVTYTVGDAPNGHFNPVYRFSYLYTIKFKGVEIPLPVIEVVSVKTVEAMKLTVADILSDETVDILSEKIFGKYRLVGLAGRGGMAKVWKARDAFGNDVAVKMMIAGESASEDQIERFMREAEMMRNLSHRNICRIMEVGVYENMHYITMEFIDAATLADILALDSAHSSRGQSINEIVSTAEKHSYATMEKTIKPVSLDDAENSGETSEFKPGRTLPVLNEALILTLFDSILDGMAYAHNKGIVHRDLKPANIMIRHNGDPVVMDFGLAKFEATNSELTLSQQIVGTVDFMAPEQAVSSRNANELSDIFSLGAILYYMTTGQKWFSSEGDILSDTLKLQEAEPLAPRKINSKISKDLETIILKAMAREPERRYRNIEIFREDIRRYRSDEPILARPQSIIYKLSKKVKKYRTQTVAAVVILFLLLTSGLFFLGQQLKELATWGKPIFVEKFENNRWQKDWVIERGKFKVEQGRLLTKAGAGNSFYIFYKKKLYGSVAMEFEGEFLKGFKACDLTVWWTDALSKPTQVNYVFQAGGSYNSQVSIQKNNHIMSYTPLKLEEGRRYKIRTEIDGNILALYIDGKKIAEYEDMFPITEGYIGIYSYAFGDAFDNVKIYCKGVAEKVSVINIGDSYYTKGDYSNAALEYAKVAGSHQGKDIAYIALHKKALALFSSGKKTAAMKIWQELLQAPLANIKNYAALMLMEDSFEKFKDREILQQLELLHQTGSATVKQLIAEKLLSFAIKSDGEISVNYFKKYNNLYPQNSLQVNLNILSDNSICNKYYLNGYFKKALHLADNVIGRAVVSREDKKWRINAYCIKAKILYALGRKAASILTLKKADEYTESYFNPTTSEYYKPKVALLYILFNEREYVKAERIIDKILQQNPNFNIWSTRDLIFIKGAILNLNGKQSQAIALFNQKLNSDKLKKDAKRIIKHYKIKTLLLMEKYRAALAECVDYFKKYSDNADFIIVGFQRKIKSILNQQDEARTIFDNVFGQYEWQFKYYQFLKCLDLYNNNDKLTDDSLNSFTAERKRCGEWYRQYALFFKALNYIKADKIVEANAIIEKLANGDEHAVKAVALLVLGKITEEKLFTIDRRPWNKTVIWYFLGEYYLAKNDTQKAKNYFGKVKKGLFIDRHILQRPFVFACIIYADSRLIQLEKSGY